MFLLAQANIDLLVKLCFDPWYNYTVWYKSHMYATEKITTSNKPNLMMHTFIIANLCVCTG